MRFIFSFFLITLSCLTLAACGFKPMAAMGTESAVGGALPVELASVDVVVNAPRQQRLLGQEFRTTLEDLINPGKKLSGEKHYLLRVKLEPLVNPGFIAPDGTAQRFLINLRSGYELVDIRNNRVLERGTLTRNSSYSNLPNSYFSTYVAEQDTLRRLANQLAEQYRLKLASLLTTPPAEPSEEIVLPADSQPPTHPNVLSPNPYR